MADTNNDFNNKLEMTLIIDDIDHLYIVLLSSTKNNLSCCYGWGEGIRPGAGGLRQRKDKVPPVKKKVYSILSL